MANENNEYSNINLNTKDEKKQANSEKDLNKDENNDISKKNNKGTQKARRKKKYVSKSYDKTKKGKIEIDSDNSDPVKVKSYIY